MTKKRPNELQEKCWCSSSQFVEFSEAYAVCGNCGTLNAKQKPSTQELTVSNDETDFYGKQYWLSHQQDDYGQPDVFERARNDLPERVLYWLKTLLKYKLPPAKVLELGCSHGGFVAMSERAGFDSIGLEMSPWIVDLSKKIFNIKVEIGPIESQIFDTKFDVVALMDVLEHLPDPLRTMRHCIDLLNPTGILVIQTPCFPTGQTYDNMVSQNNRFLEQLKEKEHLFLFSKQSIRMFFDQLGCPWIVDEQPIFPFYDMFVVVGRNKIEPNSQNEICSALQETADGRFIEAMLTLDDKIHWVEDKWGEAETDRKARLDIIEEQKLRLNSKQKELKKLQSELKHSNDLLLKDNSNLRDRLITAEKDRADRLDVIHKQANDIEELLFQNQEMDKKVQILEIELNKYESNGLVRILKKLGWPKLNHS